ncbi:hypothetical protein EDB83DRAFT_2228483 [Lactarius deliciosus]|nr:hypothetical protein EDB83DRAFT_2228483 [Lactarius deliciosus]
MNNGKANARCGGGVWIDHNHPANCSIKIPGPNQSNQVGEIAAVIVALERLPNFCPIVIKTDSKYIIEGLTTHLKSWEDRGWIEIKNAEFFKRAAFLLRRRTAPTWLSWVKGHTGITGNEESDKLAKAGAEKRENDALTLTVPQEFDIQGAKLETLTQAVAYRGIRAQQNYPRRTATLRNIELAREAIYSHSGTWETDESIWRSMRKCTIRLRAQQFLFKTTHSTQMIGDVWFNIPHHEHRGSCAICDMTETMSHILVHCQASPVTIIWDAAKDLWPYEPDKWPTMNLGIILGIGCLSYSPPIPEQRRNGPNNIHEIRRRAQKAAEMRKGVSRLLQILISEAAHLIWVLRCERVIQERTHDAHEIKTRWLGAINKRLTEDKIIATKVKKSKESTQIIEATWGNVLRKSSDPPHNWIHNRKVLVGITTQRTQPIAGDAR